MIPGWFQKRNVRSLSILSEWIDSKNYNTKIHDQSIPKLCQNEKSASFKSQLKCFQSARFPFKEKCPTIAVTFFFLQTTILTLIGPLFTILRRALEAKSAQGKLYSKGSPLSFFTFSRKHTKPDVPKGSPLWIFFGTVRLFFENFLMSPKGPPFEFFDILQRNVC